MKKDLTKKKRELDKYSNRETERRAMCLSKWIRFTRTLGGEFSDGVQYSGDDIRVSERNGLSFMTLRRFLCGWMEELGEYYGSEFWKEHVNQIVDDFSLGDTVVFCLVDNDENVDHIPKDIKKKIRKAGKWRRDKLRHKWSYVNPLNRIHGYIVLKDVSNTSHREATLAISAICATTYTEKRGIGADLIDLAKEYAEGMGYFDLILEVATEYSVMGHEESEEESDLDEDMDIDEDTDDEGDLDGEDTDDEETGDGWYPCDSALDILGEELWKKCMRKDKRGNPTYNLDVEYIRECVSEYLNVEFNSGDEEVLWEGYEKNTVSDSDEPGEYEYGGFWYNKGKNSQKKLIQFYEMHGFKEEPDIHLNWGCFSEVPFPTMRFLK